MKKQKASASSIWSVCTGWAIPLLGLVLGIIATVNAENDKSKTLGIIGMIEAILFWIFWASMLLS